jgi:hypothetical protein
VLPAVVVVTTLYGLAVISCTFCKMGALGKKSLVSPCHCHRTMPCISMRTSVRRARHAVWVIGMRLEARVALNNLESGVVTEERIREVKRVREGYLGKGVLGSNPQHLHPQLLEHAVINLPG